MRLDAVSLQYPVPWSHDLPERESMIINGLNPDQIKIVEDSVYSCVNKTHDYSMYKQVGYQAFENIQELEHNLSNKTLLTDLFRFNHIRDQIDDCLSSYPKPDPSEGARQTMDYISGHQPEIAAAIGAGIGIGLGAYKLYGWMKNRQASKKS